MANAQLDQFIHALMWKAVPVIILCGGGAILLRELLQWLERAADRAGRSRRESRKSSVSPVYHGPTELEDAPHCPSCNRSMVKRKARRGANAGSEFWGCPDYPECRGTREI
jgi:restriction system protein